MAWWEWAIVLGLWGWAMIEIRRLRRDADDGLRTIDQRRIDAIHALEASLADPKRPRR